MMSKIPEVSAEMLSYALERAREALSGDEAVERIADYYTIDSNWAGSLSISGFPTRIHLRSQPRISSLSTR